MPYLIIIFAVLVVSPFILRLAQNQKKEVKKKLRFALLAILTAQTTLGFFNWENFTNIGRSGYELSLSFINSFLGLFFIISVLQIFLLVVSQSFNSTVVVLNFLNTFVIFIGLIRLSNLLKFQAVSLSSIGAVFLVLTGNVVALAFLNKDKYLLKKYPFRI